VAVGRTSGAQIMNKNTGGPAIEVSLKNGGTALISPETASMVLVASWRLGANGYVYKVGARKRGIQCLLHRIVANASNGFDVHHKNGVKTDCRLENLDVCTPSDHQKHHSHFVVARNKSSQVHTSSGKCLACGCDFIKHPDHRGRQKYCNQVCAKSDLKNARARNKNATK
jgi:hypothetical protein